MESFAIYFRVLAFGKRLSEMKSKQDDMGTRSKSSGGILRS
jgi:hypothetical protein